MKRFLEHWRPEFWLSDHLGSQRAWAKRGHPACLVHLIRDVQYADDAGDVVFAPGMKSLLKRACALGCRRDRLAASTFEIYEANLEKRLDRLLALHPVGSAGKTMQRVIKRLRQNLRVWMTNRDIEPANSGSERALTPYAVYRKITNGFRSERAARHYADIRSVVETARRRGLRAIDAIRMMLARSPMPNAA